MAQEESHRGRGHPAFTRAEAIEFIKRRGVALSSEIAEEFDVTDVAVRKRLKEMDGVASRKVRNRLVWYIPHVLPDEEAGAGGGGGRQEQASQVLETLSRRLFSISRNLFLFVLFGMVGTWAEGYSVVYSVLFGLGVMVAVTMVLGALMAETSENIVYYLDMAYPSAVDRLASRGGASFEV